jgi:CheY-like chemotaxis protein
MVVDDQQDVRALMRLVIELANEGMEVTCEAASGFEALAMVEACNPSVIVLDEMMPGMNGIETAARIAELRPGQLVVLCSAYLDEDVTRRARAVGITAFVPKEKVRSLPAVIRGLAVA